MKEGSHSKVGSNKPRNGPSAGAIFLQIELQLLERPEPEQSKCDEETQKSTESGTAFTMHMSQNGCALQTPSLEGALFIMSKSPYD